ncbi:unnamed protein product [Haemonchus placei]|uniref:Iso_dh domain-containing protein n=1 Tax=Haemonchus placei TaxID=6290 RepID=A0A0N4WYA0_HAEPC|nr:unnamed protein product [Haemonchus placei]
MLVKCLGKVGPISQMGSRALSTDVRRVVLIPGDGIGPEISKSVQEIFEAAKTPVEWDPVDVTPVKGRDGVFRIPSRCIELMHTNKVLLQLCLYTSLTFNLSPIRNASSVNAPFDSDPLASLANRHTLSSRQNIVTDGGEIRL